VVQEIVDERQNSGVMLHPNTKSMREAHLLAVANVAESLFPFPTPDYPFYRTFVNEPEVTQKVFTNYGNELAPDIVVLQWPERVPVMIAEVVTEDMLTEANASVWAVESRLAGVRFFLYVPAGQAKKAKALIKSTKLKNVTLRTWRNIAGLKTVDVKAL
jgi:hypothetical protein